MRRERSKGRSDKELTSRPFLTISVYREYKYSASVRLSLEELEELNSRVTRARSSCGHIRLRAVLKQ